MRIVFCLSLVSRVEFSVWKSVNLFTFKMKSLIILSVLMIGAMGQQVSYKG